MGSWTTSLRILVLIAFRNLISHRVKSLIVGSIMAFGTMLVVVGTSLLDSVEDSMERVVTSSLTGQLQVYSSKGRDELSLFGGLTASLPDIGEIEDFSVVKKELEQVDNVSAVVPMGINISIGTSGNDIDRTLADLRDAVADHDTERVTAISEQLRQLAKLIDEEYAYREQISNDKERIAKDRETLKAVQSDAFWADFDASADDSLMYLDTRLAPLAADGRLFFLRLLGTDPQLFKQSFESFEIDKGEMIPPNKRGVLISRRSHERFLKHKIAREFDRIKREIELEGRDLEDDELLQGRVRRMARQYRRILYQLDPDESAKLEAKLKVMFPEEQGDLTALLQRFLSVDHTNFNDRYDYFYAEVAPLIELYRVNVGDVVTLQSSTRRGYIKAVNVKVWGTFQFKGIEDSDLAGVVNITDMLTFRELYGKMTAEQREELEEILEDVGVEDVSRESAEDALFGGGEDVMVADEQETEQFDEFDDVIVLDRSERLEQAGESGYSQQELEGGLALNAAIILKDPTRIDETRRALEERIADAGLELRVVDWQSASGLVGQLIIVIRLVLYIAIFIIFLVAVVIINNSMVMATMERVSEVGTMRAIGAQRNFILGLFMLETLVLGILAGLLGGVTGALIIELCGYYGIPASNEIVRFIFAGPYLYPHVSLWNIVFAGVVIFLVSVIATLYPAVIATRIQPVVAMRGRE